MSNEELLLDANRKWLAARAVTDWPTMRRAIRAVQKKAMRKFDDFVEAFNEWEMLSGLNPDGTNIALNSGTEYERDQIRRRIVRIWNYIKGDYK